LHGLFGSSDNWVSLGRIFAEKFSVILVDQRNHGLSPKSDEWNYPAMAADIQQLAANLGYSKINLIGHSMGGKVGMTIADRYPALIQKLVVADIAPKYYPIRHRMIIEGLMSINLDMIDSRQEADIQLKNYVPEASVRNFLLKNLEREHGKYKWKINLDVINNHLENVGMETYPKQEISIPVLFIRGINSDYITDEDIMEIRSYFTHSTVESIGNAGHWLHAEQPEAFVKTVLDFLDN